MVAVPEPAAIGPTEMGKLAALARALDAEIELFHCIEDIEIPRPRPAASDAQEGIHQAVEHHRRPLEALAVRMRAGGLQVRTSVRWDRPAYAGIVRQVLRHQPHLLIAHPTRRGRGARRFLGRTDFRLIESCPCPLLFIKTRRPYADSVVVAAVDPARAHRKPAALDGEILAWAARLRDALTARLFLFNAHVPLDEAIEVAPELREAPEEIRADVAAAWRNSLEGAVLALGQEYSVPRHRIHIAETAAPEALARFAGDVIADIVVMGAATRSGLGRLLVGHTAQRVFDALDCDLLIVKPPGFRSSVSPQSTHHFRRIPARAQSSMLP
jgi:universal stress protein E